MKNLSELHKATKEVSAVNLFKGELGTATAIQIDSNGTLKEHISKTPALLLCVSGSVTYKDDTKQEFQLAPGDNVNITADVKHWLYASVKSQLLLLK